MALMWVAIGTGDLEHDDGEKKVNDAHILRQGSHGEPHGSAPAPPSLLPPPGGDAPRPLTRTIGLLFQSQQSWLNADVAIEQQRRQVNSALCMQQTVFSA